MAFKSSAYQNVTVLQVISSPFTSCILVALPSVTPDIGPLQQNSPWSHVCLVISQQRAEKEDQCELTLSFFYCPQHIQQEGNVIKVDGFTFNIGALDQCYRVSIGPAEPPEHSWEETQKRHIRSHYQQVLLMSTATFYLAGVL